MITWFTNGWLRRGSKKKAVAADQQQEQHDKENADRPYPTMKKAKKKKPPQMPGDTGSWMLCKDRDGMMYWWNDATGQWTYQLYSLPQQQQQQQQQGQGYLQHLHLQQHHQQMLLPMQQQHQLQHQLSYSHLSQHQYNPNSSPPLGPAASPETWQMQQPWGLPSPSAMTRSTSAANLSAFGSFNLGWGAVSDSGGEAEEEEEEEEGQWAAEKKAGGKWEKFYDSRGQSVWIHSKTGSRTSVNPTET